MAPDVNYSEKNNSKHEKNVMSMNYIATEQGELLLSIYFRMITIGSLATR